MPLTGSKSFCITALRVSGVSAPLPFISQAAVSVNDAPAPSNCWKVTFSSTVTVWLAPALLPAKLTGACGCSPRVTFRPPPSSVVVSQTLTGSPAANADGASATPTPPAARTRAAAMTGIADRFTRMVGSPFTRWGLSSATGGRRGAVTAGGDEEDPPGIDPCQPSTALDYGRLGRSEPI